MHHRNTGVRLVLLLWLMLNAFSMSLYAAGRMRYNFNPDWHFLIADQDSATFFATPFESKHGAQAVTLPHAFNEGDAFRVPIKEHTDTIVWYFKSFRLPAEVTADQKVFIEFEGVRQGADVYLNGHHLGLHENGVMAFGFDLTPYLIPGGENRIALRIDNDWQYRERGNAEHSTYQWQNNNFNANYGGIPKNVYLHVTAPIYQTLPLYSNLGTVGTYVYATHYDVGGRKAEIHVESQVKNESPQAATLQLEVEIVDPEGNRVARYSGGKQRVAAGATVILTAQHSVSRLHFWSWGYGYLYTVHSRLVQEGRCIDDVPIRTGFRKTEFGQGLIRLNDRVLMMKGFAQRTSNEWPAVGMSVPAWLSDYSNALMVADNANLVRWMHVTPWKQDVESCDRVGLIEAMPAGDAEKDCEGRRWSQRTELMRDAIIYNRNNPSILFYECGNESISREHMVEMKQIRDTYDPHGGRAIGSREMLDIDEAEYGGEMLYINKSGKHPMWAMEYCRDEGYRQYHDNWSYPYHQQGAGPYYRKAEASVYNQNQDELTVEQIRRWYDYWIQRPGSGTRVSSGGVKIIFSDTNTHGRSEFNYRVSGVTDPMRIAKESYYAHQVMWNGWVDIEQSQTYIVGHWNYPEGIHKPLYVVSTSPDVELYLNGRSLGHGRREYDFLHIFDDVTFEAGELLAVGRNEQGETESDYRLHTVGAPYALRLTLIENPAGMRADGADLALIQVEVVDAAGERCPLDNRFVRWRLEGEGTWLGGIAKSPDGDNYIGATTLPVEAGVSRVLVRSTTTAGTIRLIASALDLPTDTVQWTTLPVAHDGGLSTYFGGALLPGRLDRGETPRTPSYTDRKRTIPILEATAGANADQVGNSFDDNELSEWRNDGKLKTAWITYTLREPAAIDELSLKLTGWRQRSYPIEVVAETDEGTRQVVWSGDTPKSLGYVNLKIERPVRARRYTIRQVGSSTDREAFGQIVEVAAATAGELDLYKTPGSEKTKGELRIVEIDFLQSLSRELLNEH
jgi:hypothetical protein